MRSRANAVATPIPPLTQALGYFAKLLLLIRPYWGGLLRGILLGMLVGMFGLVPPYISKLYFDNVYPAHDVSLLHVLVLGAAAFAITSALMSGIRGYYTQVVATKLSSAVNLTYFNHLQHLPVRFFDEHRVGEVMSRLTDMRGALTTLSRMFQTVIMNGTYLILVPPFLILLSARLSVVALIATPVTAVISTFTSRISRRYMKRAAEAGAELSAIQVEALSQIRTLKGLAAEHKVFSDARDQTEEALHHQLRSSGVLALIGAFNATLRAANTAIFTWYAWTLILRGEMSLGDFVAFSAYLGYLTGPVSQVAGMFADFQQTSVTLGRAFEYLNVEPEQDPERAYDAPSPIARPLGGPIELEDVSFGYTDDHEVLHDLSVTFEAGIVTAIVGDSGSGKSTIVRLLCRMGAPDRGSIRFDGVPVEQIPHTELRRQLGVVWQEPTLLRGTIWENLTFGLGDDVSRTAVDDAIYTCRLDALMRQLPAGYDTPVAEWGATLSGGQRQRFSIARALLRKPPILLLDEATSQIDVRSERELLSELIHRARGQTIVLVTHRIATASIADRICMIEAGRLTAYGTHDELLRQNVAYREMSQAPQPAEESRRVRLLGAT